MKYVIWTLPCIFLMFLNSCKSDQVKVDDAVTKTENVLPKYDDRVQQLITFIAELDAQKLYTGSEVLNKVKSLKSDDKATNDALFFKAYDYLIKVSRSREIAGMINAYPWTLDDYSEIVERSIDMDLHEIGSQLKANGLKMDGSLGNIEVLADPNVLSEVLDHHLSKPVIDYIALQQLSYQSKILDGNNVNVPLTSVFNQANQWTNFLNSNPNFPHAAMARMYSDRFADILINGTKTTPAFDHASRIASQEYRDIWSYVLKNYPKTIIGKQVATHVKYLEKNNWKYSDEQHVH